MQSSGTGAWAQSATTTCEDAAKGLVEGIEPTAAGVRGRRQTSSASFCWASTHAVRTSDSRSSKPLQLPHMDLSNADVHTGGFRYVLMLLGTTASCLRFPLLNKGRCAHHILNPARLETMWERKQCVQTAAGSLWAMPGQGVQGAWHRAEPTAPYSSVQRGCRAAEHTAGVCALCSLTQGLTRTQTLGARDGTR
jgi:hypothetical protein